MPTIIALDVSLSMTRAVPVAVHGINDENITYNQLAVQGINEYLNYLSKNSKLEHVALVSLESSPKKSDHDINIYEENIIYET